jgi:hypothetical protein
MDILVVAAEFGIGKSMSANILGFAQVLAHRLPGNGPILSRLIIPQINIMTGPIEGNAIGAKTGNALKLGPFVKGISSGVMGEDRAHILDPQVIGPGNGYIRSFNDIFTIWIVKISVFHN